MSSGSYVPSQAVPPQADVTLEAVLVGVSEECAPRTARSISAGVLPLRGDVRRNS